MSGQQSSIDISVGLICIAACMSSEDMAGVDADAPTGSIAKDMAMANATMVRTNRIDKTYPSGRNKASIPYPGSESSP